MLVFFPRFHHPMLYLPESSTSETIVSAHVSVLGVLLLNALSIADGLLCGRYPSCTCTCVQVSSAPEESSDSAAQCCCCKGAGSARSPGDASCGGSPL